VLHELDKSILAMHSFEDITRHALINMQQLIQFDRGAVLFADIATDTNTYGDFVYQVAMNEPTDEWVDLRQALQQTIQNTQMPTIMREVDDGDRLWCAAPMIVGEQLVGALVVNFDRPANPTPADRTALQEIAAQLAIALHTLHLNEQIRRQNEELEQRVQQRTEQLNAALAVERQLSELKARMMSMISHELRNPLTAILASVHILGQYDDRISDARKKEHITKIQRQAEQMRQIMEETLVLGRAETAGLNPHFELYDLSTLIRQQNEDMQSTFPNRTVHYSTSGVPHLIALDPKLIGHVLGNLLSNAAKYSSADKPITCDVHYHDDYAELSISDNGMGIPKEELDHLGEPFFRASNVRTIQGTGLGLSLVRRIVEVHHGTMTIASELYKGTTVTLSLPYRR
jgi:signal transduction histidine kinase